ncbi:hypothetical protein PMZ80_010893 [Knufia obscura]|uniref:Uncharacterized protein n=2 Tax=Knufia TaxID=430999 RepID=A0AAN8I2E2_9EURO|nr:hypothetical protein PMZ80_010893 [Knufia obscura]KAK5948499.1 hypothetical protein OHC33_010533 [Knufia fluminis]
MLDALEPPAGLSAIQGIYNELATYPALQLRLYQHLLRVAASYKVVDADVSGTVRDDCGLAEKFVAALPTLPYNTIDGLDTDAPSISIDGSPCGTTGPCGPTENGHGSDLDFHGADPESDQPFPDSFFDEYVIRSASDDGPGEASDGVVTFVRSAAGQQEALNVSDSQRDSSECVGGSSTEARSDALMCSQDNVKPGR